MVVFSTVWSEKYVVIYHNSWVKVHLHHFDDHEEGDGEGDNDEEEGADGEEQGADPRPLLAGWAGKSVRGSAGLDFLKVQTDLFKNIFSLTFSKYQVTLLSPMGSWLPASFLAALSPARLASILEVDPLSASRGSGVTRVMDS